MEKHCLNCVWFNKEKKHCDYEFGTSRYKPDFLDDDNNFVDDNNELIEDVNVLEDFRCHKYYERPHKIINPMDLLEDYKNIVDKIKEHIKTELEKRYGDIKPDAYDNYFLACIIKDYLFEFSLENKLIYISYLTVGNKYANDCNCVETFDELFKYIDDVISEEA